MADDILKRNVQRFVEEVTKTYSPSFSIKNKEKPTGYFAILQPLVTLFNPKFKTNYITVLLGTCWVPPSFSIRTAPDQLNTIAHETVHEADRKRMGTVLFTLLYAAPQILALFSLLSLLAIWFSPLWLLSLISLLFLAPIPSPGRTYIELRGYRMNLIFEKYMGWIDTPELMEMSASWYAQQFTGPWYYFMWPFKKHIIKLLCDIDGLEEKDPIYKNIMAWIRKEDIKNRVL